MPDLKLNQIPNATLPLDGDEFLLVDQAGLSRKITVSDLPVTAAGNDSEIQLNNLGSLGGVSGLKWDSGLRVESPGAVNVPMILKAAALQTAHLLEIKNSADVTTGLINNNGSMRLSGNLGLVGASGPVNNYPLSLQNNGTSTWIELLNNGGINQGVFFGITGSNFEFWNYQAGGIRFQTAPNPTQGLVRFTIGNTGLVSVGNTTGPGQFNVLILTASTRGSIVRAAPAQTATLAEWQNSAGSVLSSIRNNGAFKPVHLDDASAGLDSIYYSTTVNKLCYKDSVGVVNELY